MFRLISIILLSFAFVLPVTGQKQVKLNPQKQVKSKKKEPVSAFQELINAERDFAALALKSGIKTRQYEK